MFYRTSVPTVFDMFFFYSYRYRYVAVRSRKKGRLGDTGCYTEIFVCSNKLNVCIALSRPVEWIRIKFALRIRMCFFSMQIRLSKITLGLCEFAVIDHQQHRQFPIFNSMKCWGYQWVKKSVVDPEWFIPDSDPALNFPSSGSRQKFRIHADPDPTHIIYVYLEIITQTLQIQSKRRIYQRSAIFYFILW